MTVRTAATPAPSPPPVRPLLFGPLAHKFSKLVCASLPCYPPPPKPAAPVLPPTPVPPFNAAFYLYNGDTIEGSEDHIEHVGATLGYKTKGMLSRRNIPWSIDMDIDFNSSVFDSNFLAFQHRPFLTQIGYVPGMAAHVKSSFGPAALMLEWNGAIDDATFADEALELDPDSGALNVVPGRRISIEPSAWQIQFAYQFDFNPSVEAIGAQGTYFVIGYSESEDLAGVTRVVVDPRDPSTLTPTRVGFVPERRLSVGLGEWIWPSLRLALEYSYEWDYSRTEGGSGRSADGFFGQLTYEW